MKNKRVVGGILLVVWLLVIFWFSNQSGLVSEQRSDNLTNKIIDNYSRITKKEISEKRRKQIMESKRFLVRKTAHFTLYFTLGIIVYYFLSKFNIKHVFAFIILFCFLYACSDEFHQIFIDGRTAKVLDILIDTCGALISNLIIILIKKNRNKMSNYDLKDEMM